MDAGHFRDLELFNVSEEFGDGEEFLVAQAPALSCSLITHILFLFLSPFVSFLETKGVASVTHSHCD